MYTPVYGLTEREERAVLIAARLLLIRLSHEQPDYERQLQGFELTLEERVAAKALNPVPAALGLHPLTDADEARDEAEAFEHQTLAGFESYIDWH